jgi:hypothetical protein
MMLTLLLILTLLNLNYKTLQTRVTITVKSLTAASSRLQEKARNSPGNISWSIMKARIRSSRKKTKRFALTMRMNKSI